TTTVKPTTTTTVAGDRVAPVISGLTARSVTATAATITWTTNEASDSLVEYWPSGGAVRTASNATRVTAHSVPISGLPRYTTYTVRVKSKDAAGNMATSATMTFRTSYF
ncbi:MAG: fibronectin type III domain-containing protein, partial [Acidimicrobiales bacterium]|nr:fibronectin type III domain-containing protein [Acidimicrobiales bacterium]